MCEAFIRNAIEMGDVSPERKDTTWFADSNPKVHRLVMNSLRYPTLPPAERAGWQERTRECIGDYARSQIRGPGPFGWKMGFSLFMMPMVLDAFPSARVVHLIRDGRDVMLSRLNARMDFRSALNRLVVFGDVDVTAWRGAPLTADTVAAYRDALEMLHWVTAVSFGLRGRAYGSGHLTQTDDGARGRSIPTSRCEWEPWAPAVSCCRRRSRTASVSRSSRTCSGCRWSRKRSRSPTGAV